MLHVKVKNIKKEAETPCPKGSLIRALHSEISPGVTKWYAYQKKWEEQEWVLHFGAIFFPMTRIDLIQDLGLDYSIRGSQVDALPSMVQKLMSRGNMQCTMLSSLRPCLQTKRFSYTSLPCAVGSFSICCHPQLVSVPWHPLAQLEDVNPLSVGHPCQTAASR